MALLRIGGARSYKKRDELLESYEGEEPYMPGGYDTPYDGEEPWLPEEYDAPYEDDYDDGYEGGYDEGEDDYGYDDGPSRYDDDYGYDEAHGYDGEDWPPEEDYDRAPYYDEENYIPQREYPAGPGGALLQYLDEHDWVTWVTLLLFPPVGIWLLWRRRRYSPAANVTLGVLSALWLVAAVALLVFRPFSKPSDTTITPQPVGAAAIPTAQPEAEEEETPAGEEAEIVPAEVVDEANAVYTVAGAPYYHQNTTCTAIQEGADVQRVSRNAAVEESLMACPYCLGSQYSDGTWDLQFVTADTEDRSNIRVYCSAFNAHFHVDEACSDIGGDAHQVSLKDALLMGKTACEVCCPSAAKEFYCTVDGSYYHVDDECSGMRNASHVTYAEARVTGKKRCPVCIGGEDETELDQAQTEAAVAQAAGYYVYATPKGAYYHVNSTCSGMKGAQQVLLSDMLKQNRPACPVCCPDAEAVVFAQKGNPYYHSYATCSGMTNATQGILVNALAAGLTRCPECWAETAEGASN